ncbi:hypothetical protein [Crossiella sp. CA198]|uniref:hypothetical protein n=1 Tax=Crossiella sp. CA198 TaxID=3455607 RepID=UPI003F8D1CC7
MGKRTRDILLLTCCVAAIGAAGLYIHGIMTGLSGAPIRQGEANAERTGQTTEGKVEIRLTETLRVGEAQHAQVVPSGTVLQVDAKLLPAGDGALRCKLGVQAGAKDTPRVSVNSCAANAVSQRVD